MLFRSSDKMRIAVTQNNSVGKIVFGKISKVEDLRLSNMSDVDTSIQENDDVLVYDSSTNGYKFRKIT